MDFRTEMLKRLRNFEGWAWKDELENPQDYRKMGFQEWFEMFVDYMEAESNG